MCGPAADGLVRCAAPGRVRADEAVSAGYSNAVQYAHARRVLHRDIKPSNVLVTRIGAGSFCWTSEWPSFWPRKTRPPAHSDLRPGSADTGVRQSGAAAGRVGGSRQRHLCARRGAERIAHGQSPVSPCNPAPRARCWNGPWSRQGCTGPARSSRSSPPWRGLRRSRNWRDGCAGTWTRSSSERWPGARRTAIRARKHCGTICSGTWKAAGSGQAESARVTGSASLLCVIASGPPRRSPAPCWWRRDCLCLDALADDAGPQRSGRGVRSLEAWHRGCDSRRQVDRGAAVSST